MDTEMQDFLQGVMGVCEANSNEQHMLWRLMKEHRPEWTWEQINPGLMEIVGHIYKRPICISLFKVRVNGNLVLFWYATSQMVDYKKIDIWMEENIPDSARETPQGRINKADAANFINIMPR